MATRALTQAARAAATSRAGASRGFSVLTAAEEFPGVPATSPAPKKGSVSSVTTLPSGLTVVTENAALTSTVALTYPKAGSSNEGPSEAGASLANRYLSFKSAGEYSSAVIVRALEDAGASLFSSAGRRGATMGFTATREVAADEEAAQLLFAPSSFEKWDVKEAQSMAGVEAKDANENAQVALTDQIYAAAYGAQSTMGRSYYTAGASSGSIQAFRARTYGVNGAVLAATGVADHEAFVRMIEEVSPNGGGDPVAAAVADYLGGEARLSAPSTGYAHVALAFQGPTSSPVMSVVKHCLGASGAAAFAAPGVMGVYGGSAPGEAAATVDALSNAVGAAPSADVVAAAKAAAKAEALAALDGGSKSLADAMTASVLDSCGFSAKALSDSYDAVSADDVSKAYSAMLGSKLSLAAVGDISSVPYHATIASRFA